MKKLIALLIVLLIAFSAVAVWLLYGQHGNDDRNARLAAQALESGDYERARKLYGYIINDGKASDGDKQIYEIISAYLDAGAALKKENFNEGLDILNALRYNYGDLPIGEDIDNMRISLAHGAAVNDRLDALENAVKNGPVGAAESISEEIEGLDLTASQRERYFSIRRLMLDSSDDEPKVMTYYVDTDNGSATLYSEADSGSDVLRRIPDGEPVAVIGLTENSFVQASYRGDMGYIRFSDLSPTRRYKKDDKDDEDEPKDDDDTSAPVSANYTVRVDVDDIPGGALDIRSGPGSSYSLSGTIDSVMVLTIVEEKDGWGRLKSGAGWIELRYCARN